MNISFIGIGHMARHVLEAGYDLTVHDLRKEAAQPAVRLRPVSGSSYKGTRTITCPCVRWLS